MTFFKKQYFFLENNFLKIRFFVFVCILIFLDKFAKHPPGFMKPKDESDNKMAVFNFIFFFILSVLVGMFQVPWAMRSLKNNGPSFSASLVLLYGIVFSTLLDKLLFGEDKMSLRRLVGGSIFIVGVYFIGYEKYKQDLFVNSPKNTGYDHVIDTKCFSANETGYVYS